MCGAGGPSQRWTPQSIGDLVDVARRAAELVGSSTEISGLGIASTGYWEDVPTVQLILEDPEQSEHIRQRITDQAALPHDELSRFVGTWTAEVDDLRLRVICVEQGVI
jgi:hypothetical protein